MQLKDLAALLTLGKEQIIRIYEVGCGVPKPAFFVRKAADLPPDKANFFIRSIESRVDGFSIIISRLREGL